MTKPSRAIIWAMIFAGFLTTASRADEAKLSALQTALSGTTISGYVDVAIGYFPPQSDTLALLDEAERSHWSGIAGQVLLVSSANHTHETLACQSTLFVYTSNRGRISMVGEFTTAEDGTFVWRLPPGTYVIEPFLPDLDLPLSCSPVVLKVSGGRITPVEINIFEGRNPPRRGNSNGGSIYGIEASRSKWKGSGPVPGVLPPLPISPPILIGSTQPPFTPLTQPPLPHPTSQPTLPPYSGFGGSLIIVSTQTSYYGFGGLSSIISSPPPYSSFGGLVSLISVPPMISPPPQLIFYPPYSGLGGAIISNR